jgi:hypothetical protein
MLIPTPARALDDEPFLKRYTEDTRRGAAGAARGCGLVAVARG